jgi:ABC-type dipeptide/oligopeptide/nickel transport system ATPase subunit
MGHALARSTGETEGRYRPVDAYLMETATRMAGVREDASDAADKALALVGLEYADVRGKDTNQCSGNEVQRISVARAPIPDHSLIIADEPVSLIDAARRMIIIHVFLALEEEAKSSFLYITHDLTTPTTSATSSRS